MHDAHMYLATDNILNISKIGGCKENPLKITPKISHLFSIENEM